MTLDWHMERSIPVPESGCWLWLGAEKGNGYGNVRSRSKNFPAHRIAFIRARGEIPAGFDVCHKCDTRICINPDHLFLGTRTDNMRDAKLKGRLSSGVRHARLLSGELGPGAVLTSEQVLAIRELAANGAQLRFVAAAAGVSVDNIRRIVRHDTWKEISKCAA